MGIISHYGHPEAPFARVNAQTFPDKVDIMVIGDIPTPMEIRKGQFLSGPATGILKETLEKVGLRAKELSIHYTTAIKTAHPKKKGKATPAEIIRGHHPLIIREIQAVKPKMVLILGKTAMQTVYGDTTIKVGAVMGRVTPIPGVSEDIICMPVLHPALIMRSPADFKPFLASIELAAKLFKGGSTHDTGETQWQVLDTETKIEAALKLLATKKEVSGDMETTGLDYRIAEFLVLGIGFEKNKVFVIPREMRHRVQDFFNLQNLTWTWQHGKFDTKIMWRRKLAIVPLHDDAMYAHYVLDETSEHNLEYLSKVYLQAESYKYKMNQNFKAITLENYPEWFDALCERVAVDCDYTYQLKHVLLAEVEKDPGLSNVYHNVIMPAAPFLARVEQNGILIDSELLEEYGELYVKRLEGIMEEIEVLAKPDWDPTQYMADMKAKSAPDKFNPGSPKQMSWMVFNKLKLKPRRKKGASTDKDVLGSIEDPPALVKKVLEYRTVAKEYKTYVVGLLKWRDTDGRVRTNFSLQVTATGRLSSKEPNVQNLPNAFGVGNIRKAIIPPQYYIIMDSDYSGAELRWLACMSECPVLLDIFLNGKNLHHETAVGLYGPNYTSQDKMRAKATNFGIPYGREAGSFVDEFNISKEEAIKMIDDWLNKYHGARDYLLSCAAAVKQGKLLRTPFGRQRRFGLVTAENLHALQNEARNFPIQSPSSDTTLIAGMELEPYATKMGCQTVNLVHDSLLYYVPAEHDLILEFGYHVNQHMIKVPERLFGYQVPFASDTDIGFTWDKNDLVNLQFDSQSVIWEEKVAGQKVEKTTSLKNWLEEGIAKHSYKYEKQWYKDLRPLF